ncbi:MltR family transcriptional regulator [Pacificoceanicola onchidii]|uniref:MltR family transcriptional regulator n=1 Tax=Pacificoceanicola onchidii TaxID=2562685 RepID=UPI0010A4D679|nr:MltR family transcriptional regulator [Pacificoceanicola onchidii]
MLLTTAEDIAAFVQEIRRESDRGLPLVALGLIDELLLETLRAFFRETKSTKYLLDDGNAPLGSVSSRLHACFALGLINDFEFAEIMLLRKVRNLFAHKKHGMSFCDEQVRGYCSTLKSDLPKDAGYDTKDPRFRFENATVCMVLRLYHRADWVKLKRCDLCEAAQLPPSLWRSFEDDPPPDGQSFIAIGPGNPRLGAEKETGK